MSVVMGSDVLSDTDSLYEELAALKEEVKECGVLLSTLPENYENRKMVVDMTESNLQKIEKRIEEIKVALRFKGLL